MRVLKDEIYGTMRRLDDTVQNVVCINQDSTRTNQDMYLNATSSPVDRAVDGADAVADAVADGAG